MPSFRDFEKPFFAIPSSPTEPGLDNVLKNFPSLLKKPRGSLRELKLLHRLVTYKIQLPAYGDLEPEQVMQLLSRGRPFAEMRSLTLKILTGEMNRENVKKGLIIRRVNATYTDLRRGHVRRLGRRTVDNGTRHKVFANFHKAFRMDDGSSRDYIGLTKDLEDVFRILCKRYDQMQSETQNASLDKKLRIMAFFQLWGAAVIHPFIDANGRAFGAKLALDLNRIGFPIRKIPELTEIHPSLKHALSRGGESMVRAFFAHEGLQFLSEFEDANLILHQDQYERYMTKMKSGMKQGIVAGADENSPYYRLYDTAAGIIKMCLSKEGFLKRQVYDQLMAEII